MRDRFSICVSYTSNSNVDVYNFFPQAFLSRYQPFLDLSTPMPIILRNASLRHGAKIVNVHVRGRLQCSVPSLTGARRLWSGKLLPSRYSGATQALLKRNFHRLIFFKKRKLKIPSTRICLSKHVFRINIRRPKIFDVYTDWRSIRQEAFAPVLNQIFMNQLLHL